MTETEMGPDGRVVGGGDKPAPPRKRYTDDLALAHALADTADAISLPRFRAHDLHVATKPDHTPVTEADTATETALRNTLARARPRDAVVGEEFGGEVPAASGSGRTWVIDPIDGTKNYLRGVPIWATLIALFDADAPVLGVVSAPALGKRWWAARGSGAFTGKHPSNGNRIAVSAIGALADTSFCYASLHSWRDAGRWDEFVALTGSVWRTRAYGDFYGHVLVAEGAVDVMVEPRLSLWDAAALLPIVTEAGGAVTNLHGNPYRDGAGLLSTNGLLHDAVVTAMAVPSARPGTLS